MSDVPDDLEQWLRSFAQAVRDRDFTAGKALFHDGVIAFGTVCSRANGLNDLVGSQWGMVWPNTENFDFDYATAVALVDMQQATILSCWQSTGFADDGPPFARHGRATIVLRKGQSGWQAVHTHFSLEPAPRNDPLLRHAARHA